MVRVRQLQHLDNRLPAPGRLVRQGDKILYVMALVVLVQYLPVLGSLKAAIYPLDGSAPDGVLITLGRILMGVFPYVCLGLAKILILIGLGYAMHRLLPMIEESKAVI